MKTWSLVYEIVQVARGEWQVRTISGYTVATKTSYVLAVRKAKALFQARVAAQVASYEW